MWKNRQGKPPRRGGEVVIDDPRADLLAHLELFVDILARKTEMGEFDRAVEEPAELDVETARDNGGDKCRDLVAREERADIGDL
jgi:hypothetical protein